MYSPRSRTGQRQQLRRRVQCSSHTTPRHPSSRQTHAGSRAQRQRSGVASPCAASREQCQRGTPSRRAPAPMPTPRWSSRLERDAATR
ncbi:hypothetical protein C8Q73DRAFT_671671 [Cubamyces lactineus]|nr:hypothetical protein C8Q73DRAFT_671671 [Cubamyces lactineus]